MKKETDNECDCGHDYRVHSKTDGKCLGGKEGDPMSCKCVNWLVRRVN